MSADERTITDSVPIPPGGNPLGYSVLLPVAHRRTGFATNPYAVAVTPPYITRIRRLLSLTMPLYCEAQTTTLSTFETQKLEGFEVEIRANGFAIATVPCEMVASQNPETKLMNFRWQGTCSTQFQNPVDITHTSQIEFVSRGQLPAFSLESFVTVNVAYNEYLIGGQETLEAVQGRGSLTYDEGWAS